LLLELAEEVVGDGATGVHVVGDQVLHAVVYELV